MVSPQILEHFKSNDPLIYPHVLKIQNRTSKQTPPERYFFELCESIAYQQLTSKAAGKIFSRVLKLFGNKAFTEDDILNISHEALRATGLSNSKAMYIRNIAEASVTKLVDFNNLDSLDD